jgi:hypothetical protein
MRRYNKGFGAVYLILIILLCALVTLAGWYITIKKYNDKPPYTGMATSTKIRPIENNNQTVLNKHILSIKEWGIKFQIPAELNSMRYTIIDQSVYLDSDDLSGLAGSKKYCGDNPGYLGGLTGFAEKNNGIGGILIKKLGNTYYYYSGPQSSCLPESASNENIIDPKQYPSSKLQLTVTEELPDLLQSSLTSS